MSRISNKTKVREGELVNIGGVANPQKESGKLYSTVDAIVITLINVIVIFFAWHLSEKHEMDGHGYGAMIYAFNFIGCVIDGVLTCIIWLIKVDFRRSHLTTVKLFVRKFLFIVLLNFIDILFIVVIIIELISGYNLSEIAWIYLMKYVSLGVYLFISSRNFKK